MNRIYGHWPVAEFEGISEAAKRDFYKSVGTGMDDLRAKSADLLTTVRTERHTASEGGEFLPLSVWKSKGYNTEAIERNTEPHNVQDHPVLGKVFRVVIKKVGRDAEIATSRQQVLEAVSKKRRVGDRLALPGTASGSAGVASGSASGLPGVPAEEAKEVEATCSARAAT